MAARNFAAAVVDGDAGEDAFVAHYGGVRTARDATCRRCAAADIRLSASPFPSLPHAEPHVELKTDTYHPDDTPNVYLERWTQRPDGTRFPGGPWRAAAEGLEAFAYLYLRTGLVLWWWDLPRLVHAVEAEHRRRRAHAAERVWRRVHVRNPNGYRAIGRLVPRDELLALAAGHSAVDHIEVPRVSPAKWP